MGTSWIDFYNQLTSGSQAVSQARKDNFFRLDYGLPSHTQMMGSGGGSAAPSGKSTKPSPLWLASPILGMLGDTISGDKGTPGQRIMDVMSRGAYASANYVQALDQQRQTDHTLQPNLFDKKALDALWGGLSGQRKKTYSDVLAESGSKNNLLNGTLGFALDVGADPTTYIGPGAVKAAMSVVKRGAKATEAVGKGAATLDKATEFAKDGLVPQPQAVSGLSAAAQTRAVGDKSFSDFMKNIQGGSETPVTPFDNIVAKDTPNVSPLGIVTSRASLSKADELARKVPKFEYGRNWINQVPETGPFKIETKRVVDANSALGGDYNLMEAYGRLEAQTAREMAAAKRAQKIAQYSDLADNKDLEALGASPLMKTIMSKVDEPVYAAYEPKTVPFKTEAGRTQEMKIWVPTVEAVRNNKVMDMGQIRRILSDRPLTRDEVVSLVDEMKDPATPMARKAEIKARLDRKPASPQAKQMAKERLLNHVRAVEQWIKSGPAGYNTPAGYTALYRELYGAAPKDWEKGTAAVEKARLKVEAAKHDLPDTVNNPHPVEDSLGIPASPFTEEPTYKEVQTYAELPPAEKQAWLDQHIGNNLPPEHYQWLAQAKDPAEFDARFASLILLNDKEATGALDLADAIKNGQVLDLQEEGVPELLKHYNVKTLKALEKALRRDVKNATKPIVTGDTQAMKQLGANTRDLGPTIRPYEMRLKQQINAAKEQAAKTVAQEVKPAEQIVQEVVAGDKSSIDVPQITLKGSQKDLFNNALRVAVDKNIITPNDTELYKFVTKTGVAKTSAQIYKGKARVKDAWNLYSQYDFFKALMADATKLDTGIKDILTAKNVRGPDRLAARADYMYNLLMEPMRGMDEMLRAGGIFPVAGTREYDTPFSFYDAFSTLPPEFVKREILTLQRVGKNQSISRIAPTQLMQTLDVGVAAMKNPENTGALHDLLKASLLTEIKTTAGKTVPNYMPALAKKNPAELDGIVNDIIDALPALAQKVEKNIAMRKLWHENQQFIGTQLNLNIIAQKVASPDYDIAKALELSEDIPQQIRAVSRSKGIDPNDEFYVRAEVNAAAPEFPGLNAEARAEGARAKQRAGTTGSTTTKIDVAAMDEAAQSAKKLADEMGVPLNSLEDQFDQSMMTRMIRAIFPHFGNEVLRPMYLSKAGAAQTLARTYQGLIGKISHVHTQDAINTAWKELQIGRWSANPEIHAAQVDINKAIGVMFADDPRFALWNRIGLNAAELNSHFARYKIHPKFHLEDNESMHNVWRTWDTNDPMDLLAKTFAATQTVAAKKLLGDQLMQEFGSLTKQPGFVKLSPRGSELLRYVDTETYFFRREDAKQMRVLDQFLKESLKPPSQSQALKIYDSALHAYKSGLTIYRPGHHVRNMVGDMWLSFMAGVTDPTVYNDALKVMRQMGGRYNDFDAVKALAAGDPVAAMKPGAAESTIIYTRIGGKRVSLNAGQIYRGMYDHGVLPDYRTLEDLQIGRSDIAMPQVFGGRVHKVAATVSQSRDHYIRLAHGIDVLKKGNFKSLEAAMEQASHTVRKWHPDGSDLTHFESKFMRRTIMFYSWIRKAIPLVLEGMVMRPGRAMVYPKFMYNVAAAQGINLDSFSNPFPIDQMFPDYLTDKMQGPMMQDSDGHYMGIAPGVPMMDILGDYGGHHPLSTIIGSTSPLLKVPFEMGMGQAQGAVAMDSRTGVPIFDKSDYLDKQIPNSNLFINTTGNSLTQPWESRGGAARDYQPDTQSQWLNFLGGLGLTDMSRPGTIMQGKKDARK